MAQFAFEFAEKSKLTHATPQAVPPCAGRWKRRVAERMADMEQPWRRQRTNLGARLFVKEKKMYNGSNIKKYFFTKLKTRNQSPVPLNISIQCVEL
jgi:hypothetical protein